MGQAHSQSNPISQSNVPVNVTPMVSAHAYLHKQFDYNQNLLAPLSCSIQFHNKPNRWRTWGEHSSNRWYLGPAIEHYCCHSIYICATKAKRITDTVFFKHEWFSQPAVTHATTFVKSLQDLTSEIKSVNNIKDNTLLTWRLSKNYQLSSLRHLNPT